jgi:hypothetical protein
LLATFVYPISERYLKNENILIELNTTHKCFLSKQALVPYLIFREYFHLILINVSFEFNELNCNVHVFFKMIFSNKFGFILEIILFLYLICFAAASEKEKSFMTVTPGQPIPSTSRKFRQVSRH